MADAFSEAMAAAAGGLFSCTAMYPLEIVKNRLQVQSGRGVQSSFQKEFVAICKNDGLIGFFDGVTISSVGSATEKFLYFYAYRLMASAYERNVGPMTTLSDLVLGYLSDWCHMPVSMPMDTVGVRVQANKDPSKTTLSIIRDVMRERGIAGMYSGVSANFALSTKPAIQFAVVERTKALIFRRRPDRQALRAAEAFWLGALGRAVGTIVTYPYLRAKKLKQVRQKAGEAESSLSITGVVRYVLANDGVIGLFKGMAPELVRGVLSAALMVMVKEKLTAVVKSLVMSLLKRKKVGLP